MNRAVRLDGACVLHVQGIDEQKVNFLVQLGSWAVCYTCWDNQQLAGAHLGTFSVFKIDPEGSADGEEYLVVIGVIVPDEFALNFGEYQLVLIERRDAMGRPLLVEEVQFLSQVDRAGNAIGCGHGPHLAGSPPFCTANSATGLGG